MRHHVAAAIVATLIEAGQIEFGEGEADALAIDLMTLHPSRFASPLGLAGTMARTFGLDDGDRDWVPCTARMIAPHLNAWLRFERAQASFDFVAPLPLTRKADPVIADATDATATPAAPALTRDAFWATFATCAAAMYADGRLPNPSPWGGRPDINTAKGLGIGLADRMRTAHEAGSASYDGPAMRAALRAYGVKSRTVRDAKAFLATLAH